VIVLTTHRKSASGSPRPLPTAPCGPPRPSFGSQDALPRSLTPVGGEIMSRWAALTNMDGYDPGTHALDMMGTWSALVQRLIPTSDAVRDACACLLDATAARLAGRDDALEKIGPGYARAVRSVRVTLEGGKDCKADVLIAVQILYNVEVSEFPPSSPCRH
jgi:hypothetical protein